MRSLTLIMAEYQKSPSGTAEELVYSCFLCQPIHIGPGADRLRCLNYNDDRDFRTFKGGVDDDFRRLCDRRLFDKQVLVEIYKKGWKLFEGESAVD